MNLEELYDSFGNVTTTAIILCGELAKAAEACLAAAIEKEKELYRSMQAQAGGGPLALNFTRTAKR